MKDIIDIFVTSKHDEDRGRILGILSKQKDFNIAGVEKDEAGTIIKSARLKPDVLILDLQHTRMSGKELAPIIHRKSPSTAIIMLCDREEDNYAWYAVKAGITGFLLKETDMDKLASVIRIVYSGGYYISAPIIIKVFNKTALTGNFRDRTTEQKPDIFTPAERGIVTDLAYGLSDDQIAEHLNFSEGTIKNYITAIKRKTGQKNRIQIVMFSLASGLIDVEDLGIYNNDRQFSQNAVQ